MGKYFGTDGVRGRANEGLTLDMSIKIGQYLGWYYGKEKHAKILIGKDTRLSGDMFELGDFSKELHEKVGNEVVKNNIDILICNGENSKYIISKAEEKGMKEENIYYFENREEILELLEKIAKKGDVILFKASNGMKFFELANRMKSEEFWTNKIK